MKEGIKDTDDGNGFLTDKLVEAYLGEADSFLVQGDYSHAVEILEEGRAETGDKKNILGDRLEIASCFKEAESLIAQEEYGQAIAVLKESLPDTEADLLNDYIVQLSRMESDKYLREGDCLMALQALENGVKDTSDSSLSEREEYLRGNIVIRKDRWYCDGELVVEAELDDSGKLLSSTGYEDLMAKGYLDRLDRNEFPYSYHEISDTEWREYEYDRNDKIVKSKLYDDDIMTGWSEYEYDSSGNCVKRIDYSVDGVCREGVDYSEERYADRRIISSWTEFEYDGAGRIIVEIIYHYGVSNYWFRIDFEYDETENKISSKFVSCENGEFLNGPYYAEYDEEWNLVREISYSFNGSVSYETEYEYEYEYDEKGNATKCTAISSYGTSYVKWEKKYDELGNIIEGNDESRHWTRECEYAYIGV